MSWKDLLDRGSVERRAPDRREIHDLLRFARRQLQDSSVSALSPEASYQLAYTGVLTLATVAVRAAAYRLRSGEGQHKRSFEAARAALGGPAGALLDFFELCRRRRNVISYEGSEATESEAADLLKQATEFEHLVRNSLPQSG